MPHLSPQPRLLLTHHRGPGHYIVDMEAFFDFSFYMAEQLENLVDDWSYFARRPPDPRGRSMISSR